MKTDANEPIYPEADWANVPTFGLTKREYFAAMAILKLAEGNMPVTAARIAVEYADALIKELNKE